MNKRFPLCCFIIALMTMQSLQAQTTANDFVPTIETEFLLGVNPGYYEGWDDEGLADIGFGDPSKGLKGAGLQTLRGLLPEWFLEQWGYDIRVDEYEYFDALGGREYTINIGYPSDEHREATEYCPGKQSQVFANLYAPIWDNGENGTPVHDDNYFALYIYNMATTYKGFAKIYEVWNEPDYDFSGNGWKDEGEEGNWFENIPAPCDTRLEAPVFSYIRMLRIAYEVIKSVDSEALVAVGGLGYVSYLDIILRHTDNPVDGSVTGEYPLRGGAWFDVMSFHSYPHFDGSLRDWSSDINDFVYSRHSDAAAQGVFDAMDEYQALLNNYAYDGSTYPKKHFINTETNLPRVPFSEYIGSDEAQVNFLLKTILQARKKELRQLHIFKQAEDKPVGEYYDSFDAMGLFTALDEVDFDDHQITNSGIACATVSKILEGLNYDEVLSNQLDLPDNINGFVFSNGTQQMAALWAKTNTDQSEVAQASYTFPTTLTPIERLEWDYAYTDQVLDQPLGPITLNARPSFFPIGNSVNNETTWPTRAILNINGNPGLRPVIEWDIPVKAKLSLYNALGQLVHHQDIAPIGQLPIVDQQLTPGMYKVSIEYGQNILEEKLLLLN